MIERILDEAPGSIRELAREAGVSERLIRAVRDGMRRLTPATRDALAAVLRRWAGRCQALAEELESLELEPGRRDAG